MRRNGKDADMPVIIPAFILWNTLTATQPMLPEAGHGLQFDTPVTVWDEALPLGNGMLGALLWGGDKDIPVRISLDRTDLWDLRPVEEYHRPEYDYATMQQWEKEGRIDDLLALYDHPYRRPAPTKIPAGRIELMLDKQGAFVNTALSLADATARLKLDATEIAAWIHAEQPLGFIQIDTTQTIHPKLIAPAFGGENVVDGQDNVVGGNSVATLGYPAPEQKSGPQYQSYLQEGWGGFRFAVYLGWRQSENQWRAIWTVASSYEGDDPYTLARDRVERALDNTSNNLRQTHEAWWHSYWQKTSLSVPNPTLERQWFLDTYKFGAASRKGAPPITLQGPWTADNGKLPPWKGDYHHDLNTELSYWPCYSGNRLEEGINFLNWLWETRGNCVEWTKRFFKLPGMAVPMTADLNNNQIGGWRQYTHSATTGAWVAHHFYLHWKYSMDENFLTQRAYPYLHDCAVFFEAVTENRDADGKRSLPLSSSPEINDNRPTAWFPSITNYDLALIRWTFSTTAEMAEAVGNEKEAQHWRKCLDEMPAFSKGKDGRLLVAKNYPLPHSHRHFSHLMAIHPLGLIDVSQGEAAQRTIRASLKELEKKGTSKWTGYSFAWLASMAARARDGKTAEKALETFTDFTLRNSFHCNGDQSGKGHSDFTYRPFTLEGNFAAAAGLQEMLLQSHTGVIDIFPAIPSHWKTCHFHRLRAQGAFLVSAQRHDGLTQEVLIETQKGGPCRLRALDNPEQIQTYTLQPGDTLRQTPKGVFIRHRQSDTWELAQSI